MQAEYYPQFWEGDNMIFVHIIGNLFFILFLCMNIIGIKKSKGKIAIISFLLGCVIYVTYLVMFIIDFDVAGFDTQSFSMLILSWAFENAAYCIMKNKK